MLAGAHLTGQPSLARAGGQADANDPSVPSAPESAIEAQLQETASEAAAAAEAIRSAPSIHSFPRGPDPGTFLHGLLEWVAEQGFADLVRDPLRRENLVAVYCQRRNWGDWTAVMQSWLQHLLETPLPLPLDRGTVAMGSFTSDGYQAELEFMLAVHRVDTRVLDETINRLVLPGAVRPALTHDRLNGMVKGFIDLVFCHQARYYVLDYKSNHLGDSRQAYGPEAMAAAVLEHRYDLQYVLYTLALHRLLKARLPDYDYQRHMGGVLYLFLRGVDETGQGVYVDRPSQALVEWLDDTFAGKEKVHANG
jgi:exodeoxyribonuclease V beta subunit